MQDITFLDYALENDAIYMFILDQSPQAGNDIQKN